MKPAVSNDACGPALLVAQTSFLGDVVLTTPLVSALRRRLVPRRLALLVRPEAVPLVAGHPDIDQVLVDDKRGADRGALASARAAVRPSFTSACRVPAGATTWSETSPCWHPSAARWSPRRSTSRSYLKRRGAPPSCCRPVRVRCSVWRPARRGPPSAGRLRASRP